MLQPAMFAALLGIGLLIVLCWTRFLAGDPASGYACLLGGFVWLGSLLLGQRRLQRRIAVPLEQASAQIDRFAFAGDESRLHEQSTAETLRIAQSIDRLCERAIEHAQHERAIFTASRDAIVTVAQNGTIESFSPTAEALFGWQAADIRGQNIERLMPGDGSARHDAPPRYSGTEFDGATGITREVLARRADGSTFPVSVYIARIDRKSQPPLFCNVFRDLTEQVQTEQAMLRHAMQVEQANVQLAQAKFEAEDARTQAEDARAQAEGANRSKSEFLANMSHEIRTPMTAILGFAENLQDPRLGEAERAEAVETILRNGDHLMALINDILDLSKIEAGRLTIERLQFSPIDLCADVASLMRVRADAKRLQLDVRYDCPLPAVVRSDPTRLRQVLINLCGNAIKFTATGKVTLTVRLLPAGRDGTRLLQFEVRDTGIGMSRDQLAHMFQPFSQADNSTTRRFGGTGLGLSISKRLVEMLGGSIDVVSEPGVGSAFAFSIDPGPLAGVPMLEQATEALAARRTEPAPVAAAVAIAAARRIHGRILLAEDGPDNQRLITHLLKKNGIDVTVVADGKSAVQTALAAEQSRAPFDLVLMDMQMPVMDGYRATTELRRIGFHKPIVALTANAMAGDRERCIDAGCTDFTPKPVERLALLDMIERLLPHRPPDA